MRLFAVAALVLVGCAAPGRPLKVDLVGPMTPRFSVTAETVLVDMGLELVGPDEADVAVVPAHDGCVESDELVCWDGTYDALVEALEERS